MDIGLTHYLIVASTLFFIGLIGVFVNYRNIIVLLMSIELMLLAANLNFVAFSHFLEDRLGQVFSFFVLAVAAAETAIGLAILVLYFREKGTIELDSTAARKE